MYEGIAHIYLLGTFSTFHYLFYIFLSGYNSGTIQDINLNSQQFLGKSHLLLGGGGGAVTFSCGRQTF